ncbi:hypothetical protein PIROE2DRAFT_49477, partial [Piromyces sp. E2]
MSVGEIHYPLLRGKKIILCDDDEFNNPESIGELISKYNIHYLISVPSRFENYLNNEKFSQSFKNIRFLLIGGEKCNTKILNTIRKYSDCRVYNIYGPTEATVFSNGILLDIEKLNKSKVSSVNSIGKPICNCFVYILDKNLKPVPIGVEGEICIGGYGVGKGYLSREELTNEKFVECPFTDAEDQYSRKMYRTGDLGKWNENGEVICLGRIDFQIKLRGQRIELGEIETTVNEVEGIKYSIVIDG